MTTYYKFLNAEGRSPYEHWQWPLPTKRADGTWEPGSWTPVVNKLVECDSGYHSCDATQLPRWIDARLFVLEYAEDARVEHYGNKHNGTKARLLCEVEAWDERTQREFACDCAERVLYIFEKRFPEDKRARVCIETTRRFLKGEATREELNAAADAAYAAYDAYAANAAYAAYAAYVAYAANAAAAAYAADNAAYAADAAAYYAAAAAAAEAKAQERTWQSRRLCELLGIEEA